MDDEYRICAPSMVGSYSSTKWDWISWIVRHDLPTPPPPTTTSLYSLVNYTRETLWSAANEVPGNSAHEHTDPCDAPSRSDRLQQTLEAISAAVLQKPGATGASDHAGSKSWIELRLNGALGTTDYVMGSLGKPRGAAGRVRGALEGESRRRQRSSAGRQKKRARRRACGGWETGPGVVGIGGRISLQRPGGLVLLCWVCGRDEVFYQTSDVRVSQRFNRPGKTRGAGESHGKQTEKVDGCGLCVGFWEGAAAALGLSGKFKGARVHKSSKRAFKEGPVCLRAFPGRIPLR